MVLVWQSGLQVSSFPSHQWQNLIHRRHRRNYKQQLKLGEVRHRTTSEALLPGQPAHSAQPAGQPAAQNGGGGHEGIT